ncbi:MAG TPA: RNA polymerase sigma factor RpoD/SigA [Acidobacteriota bacterium]|nr:RNA polymerase sigma factor RpoD/SigA [Acidobacteriota bacterium]
MVDKKLPKLTDDSLKIYLSEISKIPQISPEKEKALGRRIHQGDERALRALVKANLRFAVAFAKKYRSGPLSLIDLIEEANLGLIEAAKRFDPEKGVKFITYAAWWIRQAIIHALGEQGRTIRLPQRQANLLYQLGRNYNILKGVLNRNPTSEEIAGRMEIPVEQAEELMRFFHDDVSLDTAIGSDSDLELKDVIEQQSVPPADLELIRRSFEEQMHDVVDQLDPKERIVIQERFGMLDNEPKTLRRIGEMLGVTRERVRQIEQKAINKLRRNVKVRRLRTYLN